MKSSSASNLFRVKTLPALILFCTLLAPASANADATKLHKQVDEGLELRRDGDFDAAISHFRSLLKQYPNDVRVKVELAATLAHSGQKQESNSIFNELLDQKSLNPIVRKNIEKFQKRFLHDSSKRKQNTSSVFSFNGLIGYASGEDSNVNGPLSIEALDDAEVANENVLKDNYEILKANISTKIKMPSESPKAVKSAYRIGINTYQKKYSKEESSHRNLGSYKLYVSPEFSQRAQWRLKLPVYYRTIQLNEKDIATYTGFNPKYTELVDWGDFSWNLELRQRKYLNELSEDDTEKNGLLIAMGFEVKRFIHKRKLSIEFGVDAQKQSTIENQSRAYQSFSYWSQLNWTPNRILKNYLKLTRSSYSYQGIDFDLINEENDEVLYNYHRQDERVKWQFGTSATLFKHARIYGHVTATHIDSNQKRYNYDRTKTEIGMNLFY